MQYYFTIYSKTKEKCEHLNTKISYVGISQVALT